MQLSAVVQGLEPFFHELDRISDTRMHGRVAAVVGMLVEIVGIEGALSIGTRCALIDRNDRRVPCEVVGFRDGRALAMTYGSLEGVGLGSRVNLVDSAARSPLLRTSAARSTSASNPSTRSPASAAASASASSRRRASANLC